MMMVETKVFESEISNFRRGPRRVALALTICYFAGSIAYIYFNVRYLQLLKVLPALALILAGPLLIWSAYFLYAWLAAGFRAGRPNDVVFGIQPPRLQEDNPGDPVKRFRVAFSFAGEKRDYVARMAAVLASRFGVEKILYDEYHRSEFARDDLGLYLPNLYHEESDLVVVVICPVYEMKEWCGLEWHAIFDLLKKRKHEEVMLCRFGHASVRGLYSIAGFLELDDLTADQAAANILERLALNEDKPRGYYLSGAE